jgi:hypothetical protein
MGPGGVQRLAALSHFVRGILKRIPGPTLALDGVEQMLQHRVGWVLGGHTFLLTIGLHSRVP